MPNQNQHILKVDYDVATDQHGDPVEIAVNADVFFHVSDPENIKETLALLKSRGVKSLGDFMDLVLRLSERSRLDEKTPIYSSKVKVPAKTKAPMPAAVAEALKKVQRPDPLFLGGPRRVDDGKLSEDMARVFADKLGKAQAEVFRDQYVDWDAKPQHPRG